MGAMKSASFCISAIDGSPCIVDVGCFPDGREGIGCVEFIDEKWAPMKTPITYLSPVSKEDRGSGCRDS